MSDPLTPAHIDALFDQWVAEEVVAPEPSRAVFLRWLLRARVRLVGILNPRLRP